MGAAFGAIAGLLAGGPVAALLLAAAGALLVAALVAALPDHGAAGRAHPVSEPTATLAVPPPGPDAPPGWYPDPDPADGDDDEVRRLWDGEAWTEHRWAPRTPARTTPRVG
jgi:hypothetical protein